MYIVKLTPRDDLFCALDRFELECGQLNHKYYHHVNLILFYKTLQLLSAMIVSLCLYNCISTCFVSLLAFLHFFVLLYRSVCHMCVFVFATSIDQCYRSAASTNICPCPPFALVTLLFIQWWSRSHWALLAFVAHMCVLCFSVSVFVFAINIEWGEMSPNLCVSISVRCWYLPQFFRRYILGGGKTTCQKKSQRSFQIQIWIRKNQIGLRDSNVAKKLLKFSFFLRKLELQTILSCLTWSLQHEYRLQNICPNLRIYKWE